MIAKVIALLFFAAALLLALIFGFDWPFGSLVYKLNASALNGLQAGVQRYLWPPLWDALFVPLLELPAWVMPTAIGVGLVVFASLRPGRG